MSKEKEWWQAWQQMRDAIEDLAWFDTMTHEQIAAVCNRGRVAIDRLEALAELVKGQ